MPEITLHNLARHCATHNILLESILSLGEEEAIRVQVSNIKLSSYYSTFRQLISTLLKYNLGGVFPLEKYPDFRRTTTTHRVRTNELFARTSTFFYSPQQYSSIITLHFNRNAYEPTFKKEQCTLTRIQYAPFAVDASPVLKGAPVQIVADSTPAQEAQYTDVVFLAFLELKNNGLITHPIYLINPPPFNLLPAHNQFINVAVLEDDGKLLLL